MKKIKGFTLIEMVLILIIAGVAMPPLLTFLFDINTQSSVVIPYIRPNTIIIDMLEEIKGKKWDENWIGGPLDNSSKTSPANFINPPNYGTELGELNGYSRVLFDDMDDYNIMSSSNSNANWHIIRDINGNPLPQYSEYTIYIEVYYVPGLKVTPPDYSPRNYSNPPTRDLTNPPTSNSKRIDVILKKGSSIIGVSTIVCNY